MPTSNDSLSSYTKEILHKYDFIPKKKLGQNFIIDRASLDRIVEALAISDADCIIEIGTGLGSLTRELGKLSFRVISVEYDKVLFEIAKGLLKDLKNVELVREDFLKVDIGKLLKRCKAYKIAGNLPYYITSPIIEKLVNARPKFSLAVLTMQKEVAERIVARPGTKDYGSLSIFTQYHFEAEIKSLIPKSAFLPHPTVSSAIVVLKPRENPSVAVLNEKLFFDLVHAAFEHRRKTVRNAILISHKIKISEEALDRAFLKIELDGVRRGETLSMDEFAKLSNCLS